MMPLSDSCRYPSLINGEPGRRVSIQDRGFQYGDGLFETILVRDDKPQYWRQHMQRLHKGCQRLKLDFPSEKILFQEAEFVMENQRDGVLKVILTRGKGGRGYRPGAGVAVTRVLSMHPSPDYPESWSQQGVAVRFCEQRLSDNPTLAGLKHLNRLEQVLARMEWDQQFQEGIMCDIRGNVIEGTMSNVFMLEGKDLITPQLLSCGVAGIMRRQVIRQACGLGLNVIERDITPEALLSSDGCFLTNSIIGLWPIRELAEREWAVSSCLKNLAAAIEVQS